MYKKIIELYSKYGVQHNFHVDGKEFKILIYKCIEIFRNECNLNWIDTSDVKDMEMVFYKSDFNGDISNWDISNVVNMKKMFRESKFTGDISKWGVSRVENMESMFNHCSIRDEYNPTIVEKH